MVCSITPRTCSSPTILPTRLPAKRKACAALTWSASRDTCIDGSPPLLRSLPSRLLLSYHYSAPRLLPRLTSVPEVLTAAHVDSSGRLGRTTRNWVLALVKR